MNSRLQNRFSDAEVWRIFIDVIQAVEYLHSCTPPIIHRDLKIENVLVTSKHNPNMPNSSTFVFKVCDFGSATQSSVPAGLPLAPAQIKQLEAEIDTVTTIQYRAPELCDLYSRRGIDEKIDIWALGIMLYKICYYVGPFSCL